MRPPHDRPRPLRPAVLAVPRRATPEANALENHEPAARVPAAPSSVAVDVFRALWALNELARHVAETGVLEPLGVAAPAHAALTESPRTFAATMASATSGATLLPIRRICSAFVRAR